MIISACIERIFFIPSNLKRENSPLYAGPRLTKMEKQEMFETLYNTNKNDLFVYIIRSVRDESTALDILQDVFLNFFNIYQSRPLPEAVQCRMYLFKIARNLMINHGRRAYIRKVDLVESYDRGLPAMDPPESSTEDGVILKMQYEKAEGHLRELLAMLGEEERTALILRFYHEMKLEEIASILDLSVSTISRLIQKSLQKLRQEGKKRGLEL